MLLQNYTLEVFRSKCQPGMEGIHCFAHLEQDVGAALPFLNSVLGGFEYINNPPSVTFKSQGKLITVHGDKIAINALNSEAEAVKIVEWLKNEINSAWENKGTITPCYTGIPKPIILEIFKLLPKTNCRECKEATCLVFAIKTAEGIKDQNDCPRLERKEKDALKDYLSFFKLI